MIRSEFTLGVHLLSEKTRKLRKNKRIEKCFERLLQRCFSYWYGNEILIDFDRFRANYGTLKCLNFYGFRFRKSSIFCFKDSNYDINYDREYYENSAWFRVWKRKRKMENELFPVMGFERARPQIVCFARFSVLFWPKRYWTVKTKRKASLSRSIASTCPTTARYPASNAGFWRISCFRGLDDISVENTSA